MFLAARKYTVGLAIIAGSVAIPAAVLRLGTGIQDETRSIKPRQPTAVGRPFILGQTYTLQGADEVQGDWQDLYTFKFTTPSTNLVDDEAVGPHRFYRLLALPEPEPAP